ncbi:MAG: type II toxin-antitoxin system RelE/ParE family toxin [Nanoarchaeota archaeon]|nr:type II toxin-antitoxin system RelE/ParE family toxin [Nanoarchaeota archaeon]
MNYSLEISDQLDRKLSKLSKKNPKQIEIIDKKAKEICNNPHHYKPLRGDMKGARRVHIESSFVLTFEIIEETKTVRLLDYDHHDKIY